MRDRQGEVPNQSELSQSWTKATWNGVNGYAKKKVAYDEWDFSVTLPDDVEPNSVHLGYIPESEDKSAFYTVSYRPKDTLFWRLLELEEVSEDGNILFDFSTHVKRDFEKVVGFGKINNSREIQL